MTMFINPFTDFGFKRIFGQESHKRILIGFLNALFENEFVVTDLTYRDKEKPGETRYNRSVIYDIYCTLEDGSYVIVEMQNKKEVNFYSRALYYASKTVVAQGEKGDSWQYDCAPVIGVYFLNYHQDGLGQAFRCDFGISKTREGFAHTAMGKPKEESPVESSIEPFAGLLRMVFLQMPEFTKIESECSTHLDKWAYIMNHMENLNDIPWATQDELFAELSSVSDVAALTPQERAIYDENLRQYRDNLATHAASFLDGKEEGLKEGKEAGLKEGKEERNKAIACSLMSANMPDEFVSQHTGLSLDEIHQLRGHK